MPGSYFNYRATTDPSYYEGLLRALQSYRWKSRGYPTKEDLEPSRLGSQSPSPSPAPTGTAPAGGVPGGVPGGAAPGGVADTLNRTDPNGPPAGLTQGGQDYFPGLASLTNVPPKPLPGLGYNPSISYRRPGEEWQRYSPETGISPSVVSRGVGEISPRTFMGTTPEPGGGGFVSPGDWENVAAPEEFPSYLAQQRSSLQDLMAKADTARLMRSIQDPLWEEKAKAETWLDVQTRLQSKLREAVQNQIAETVDRITGEVEREMPGAPPEKKRAEIENRMSDAMERMFGNRGAEASIRMPGGYGAEWTR